MYAGFLIFVLSGSGNLTDQGRNALAVEFLSSLSGPEPAGWYSGDIHVHRSCNGSPAISSEELKERMKENNLAVISVLGDMGNSQAPDRIEDLKKINGEDMISRYRRARDYYSEIAAQAEKFDLK